MTVKGSTTISLRTPHLTVFSYGHHRICQLLFVTSHCYSTMHVGSYVTNELLQPPSEARYSVIPSCGQQSSTRAVVQSTDYYTKSKCNNVICAENVSFPLK